MLLATISALCRPWRRVQRQAWWSAGVDSVNFPAASGEETVLPAHMSLPVPVVPWAPPEGPSRCEEMRHLSVSQAQGLPQARGELVVVP